jgi:hypothetical protein
MFIWYVPKHIYVIGRLTDKIAFYVEPEIDVAIE